MASIHDKLERVRKPRVHITYDVETEGAMVQKELPFVVGVMGDFSGDPTEPLKSLKDRKFVQIDRDNFNEVLARSTPGVKMKVDNTLAGDDSQMAVELKFISIDDFDPAKIVDPAKRELIVTHPHDDRPEKAVLKGLEWLAEHQMPDGGWSFDHTQARECRGKCRRGRNP